MWPHSRAKFDDAELRATGLPHREKYLRIEIDFMRRLLNLHLELIDHVERELNADSAEQAR